MALLPSSALTFLNIAYFKAPVSPVDFNKANYSWVEAVQGWATAASNPATFNNVNNLNPPTYGYLISPSTGDAERYVLDVYQNLFGSVPSAEHLDYWTNWLEESGNNTYIGKDGTNYGIANYQALALAVYEYATADEITALTNRQEVSLAFSTGMQSNPSGSVPTFNTAQYNAGWGIISNVTADPETVTTALAAVEQYVATTGSVGNSFVLTPDVDIEAAGRFLAAPVAGSAGGVLNTFSSGDQLTGVGDNATITLLWQGGLLINTVQPDLMENVSTLEATLIGGPLTVLSTFVTGLRNVNINDTSGDLVMTNLQSPLESVSINRSFLGADATFTIADAALAGTEDALAIRLNQVTTTGGLSELDISNISQAQDGGYEQVSLESVGLANTVGMAGVLGVQQLTITGNQNLTLNPNRVAVNGFTSIDRSITTINATDFDANLTMTVADANNSITFNGGLQVDTFTLIGSGNHTLTGNEGDDVFIIEGAFFASPGNVNVSGGEGDDLIYFTNTFGNGNFTANDVIAGNEGVNTLQFDDSAQAEVIQSNTNTVNNNITGIQVLSFVNRAITVATAPLRADLFGTAVNTVTFEEGTQNNYTVRFRAGESTVNINPIDFPLDTTGGLAVEANGIATNDSLILNLVGQPNEGDTPRNINMGGLTLDQNGRFVENLTINANGADTAGHTVGGIFQAFAPGATCTITIAGESALTLTGAIQTNRIDATGLTGETGLTMLVAPTDPTNADGMTILGSEDGVNVLLGSSEADTITGGGAQDTITGRAGADILTGGGGRNTFIYNGGSAANAGIPNVDVIRDFKAGAGNDQFQFTTGANNFLNGLTLAANSTVNLNATQTILSADNLTDVFAGIAAIGASTDAALQAKQIDVTLGAASGSYLYINDATAGVSNANDYLVEITNFTGLLGAGNFTFV